jgi:hypothetical protein
LLSRKGLNNLTKPPDHAVTHIRRGGKTRLFGCWGVVLAPRYRNIIFAFHMSAADERGWGSFMPELGVVAQL